MRFFTLLPGVQRGFHLFNGRKILGALEDKAWREGARVRHTEGLAFPE